MHKLQNCPSLLSIGEFDIENTLRRQDIKDFNNSYQVTPTYDK